LTPYCSIKDLHIPIDPKTGKNRGFAFVTFHSSDDAQTALENLDNTLSSERAKLPVRGGITRKITRILGTNETDLKRRRNNINDDENNNKGRIRRIKGAKG
jgi:RNA recognition motif-containing protein